MKIVTWNVNSIRVRLEHVKRLLLEQDVDVLLLQETKCTNDMFPFDYFNDFGYNAVVNGQKSYNGVAIISKYLIDDVVRGGKIFEIEDARYIEASIRGIRFACVYVPNGKEVNTDYYFYKLRFFDQLIKHINNINKNLIMCGDFNVTRSDNDVWNPKLWYKKNCCSTPERAKIQNIIDSGFYDCLYDLNTQKYQGMQSNCTLYQDIQYQDTLCQDTSYRSTSYQGNQNLQHRSIQYRNTQPNNARFNDTQYRDTQYRDTQYQDTQYQDTQYQDTQYQDTQYQDTQYQDTQYQDTQYQDTFTWWDYRNNGFQKNYGLRLDYIFTTSNIHVQSCYRLLQYRKLSRPSDHCPVLCQAKLILY